jgi:predicted enzyme related to lactoylglutathione lyase
VARVTGIGGVFFRARDPERLRTWYAENLGLELESFGGVIFRAREGDETVWHASELSPEYHGSGELGVMLNYRVDDLDTMLAQLRAAGVEVLDRVLDEENGRFAWAVDAEGNRFELWQPR